MTQTAYLWQAPRWAAVGPAAKDLAVQLGLKYEVDIDKGWITERGRITLTGSKEQRDLFVSSMNKALAAYNKG